MKLTIALLILFVSFASAQENKKGDTNYLDNNVNNSITINKANTIVINIKGIKTMKEIDIENYNKFSYLKLIASKKQKPKVC